MVHNLIKKMIIGILIGLSTSYIIIALITLFNDHISWTGKDLMEEVLIAAVLGLVIGISITIFEINRLSFILQLIVHYFIVLLSVFVAGLVGNWFSLSDWQSVAKIVGIQCITYFICWFMVRTLMKKEIDEINNLIKHRRTGK